MKRRGPPPEFLWLHKYSGSSASNRSSSDFDTASADIVDDDGTQGLKTAAEKVNLRQCGKALEFSTPSLLLTGFLHSLLQMLDIDSPDIVVPRQSIAQGATPIAARESVIRHQMSMKEDDYTFSQVLRYQ